MASQQQKAKLADLIRRAGLWDEAIGFIFLGFAALNAFQALTNPLFETFLLVPFLAGALTVWILLYCLVGAGFVITGYYLHSVRGEYTKRALGVSTGLSVLTILNIIPLIPTIFSIYALVKLRTVKLPARKIKQPAAFDVRNYPALSIMALLLIVTGVATIMSLQHTHSSRASKPAYQAPAAVKADCQPAAQTAPCVVATSSDGFSATFPRQPKIVTLHGQGGNPVDSYDQHTKLTEKIYTYLDTNDKIGNENVAKEYVVSMVDYRKEIVQERADMALDIQQTRLQSGASIGFFLCDPPDNKELWDIGQYTTHQELPAFSVSLRDGKSYSHQACSIDSLAVLKGTKVYNIRYVAYPAEPDSTNFTKFLQTFRFTD